MNKTMPTRGDLLVKIFTEEEHAKALLNGVLYCQRLKTFREIESSGRVDRTEGAILLPPGDIRFTVDSKDFFLPKTDLVGNIVVKPDAVANLVIWCCSRVPFDSKRVIINADLFREFEGLHAVLILNVSAFRERVGHALADKGYGWELSAVEYYRQNQYPLKDAFASGVPSPRAAFLKDERYAHQKEVRLAIWPGSKSDEAMEMEIGDIRDIACHVYADKDLLRQLT